MPSDACKWVLLRHEMPDGTWHFDWLLSRPDAPELGLWSFRIMCDPSTLPERFEATPTPDHRRIYLQYEGEVSGGRGFVRRVNQGTVVRITVGADGAEVELGPPSECRYRGTGVGDRWIFEKLD